MNTSRRTRRLLRLGVPSLVLALAAGGWVAWQYTDLLVPDPLCGGAVAASDVRAVLGGGRIEVVASERSHDRADPKSTCIVSVADSGKESGRLVLRTVGVDPVGAIDPAMSQPDRGPIGGFFNTSGWMLLPSGCRLPARGTDLAPGRDADAVEVSVRSSKGGPGTPPTGRSEEAPLPEARAALARLSAGFGAAVARATGCGSADVPDTHLTAAGSSAQRAVNGQLCEQPGAGTGPGATPEGLYQRVSDPAAPVQVCWIHHEDAAPTEAPAIRFTSSTDPRFPGLLLDRESLGRSLPPGWRGKGTPNTVVAPCGNGTLLLSLMAERPYVDPGTPTIDAPLFRTWAAAVTAEHDCEPVAPR
ncbi:hypothetical protein ACWGB8_23545 [Kitasatospora sp. NPDC054939]